MKKYIIRRLDNSSMLYLKSIESNSWVCTYNNKNEVETFDSKEEAQEACESIISQNGWCLEIVEILFP